MAAHGDERDEAHAPRSKGGTEKAMASPPHRAAGGHRLLHRALLLLTLLFLCVPPARAESPTHGACDATGRLVCAGADLGADVRCAVAIANPARVSCAWTYGWLVEGSSPVHLPGRESHVVDATVRVCSSVSGCETTPFHHAGACSWIGLATCLDSQSGPAGSVARDLALGECLTVTVDLAASIEASVVDGVATLATAQYHATGQGAGAICLVDDGR